MGALCGATSSFFDAWIALVRRRCRHRPVAGTKVPFPAPKAQAKLGAVSQARLSGGEGLHHAGKHHFSSQWLQGALSVPPRPSFPAAISACAPVVYGAPQAVREGGTHAVYAGEKQWGAQHGQRPKGGVAGEVDRGMSHTQRLEKVSQQLAALEGRDVGYGLVMM